jgi:hypothetical protein
VIDHTRDWRIYHDGDGWWLQLRNPDTDKPTPRRRLTPAPSDGHSGPWLEFIDDQHRPWVIPR